MTNPRRVELHVLGRVQGVYYRANARDEARARGLTGWVRNEPDGSVRAVVEGPADQVEAFITWARRGPPSARVDQVRVTEAPPTGEFSTFEVHR